MRQLSKQERIVNVGQFVEEYREAIVAAHSASASLAFHNVERPWITIDCDRAECAPLRPIVELWKAGEQPKPTPHTHRIRLEIR